MKNLHLLSLSALLLVSLSLITSCGRDGSTGGPSSSASVPDTSIDDGFVLVMPDGTEIECDPAPRNTSAPVYSDTIQLKIMGGWVNVSAATSDDTSKQRRSFGVGSLTVNFQTAQKGAYPLAESASAEAASIQVGAIEDYGLTESIVSQSGTLEFETIELDENKRPLKAKGRFQGTVKMQDSGTTAEYSGRFAIGMEE